MKKIRPADQKAFAGTRDFGIVIRTLVEAALKEHGGAVVDLAGVADMSPSFADECFGKLAEQLGAEAFASTVIISGGAEFKPLIDGVVRLRLQRRKSLESKGLVAR